MVAGRIRDEDIAAVRERSPIDEVVGEYLQLRNAGGGSLKGLCPFHEEKTPSFNVTPARGLFYCFSCAEGGDAIKFVQKIDGLSFVEAVERLAGRAGIDLRYEQGGYVPGQEQSQRRRLIDAHRAAAEFYAERLGGSDAAHARAFLAERGFELADVERFGVGYSPKAWEDLTRHLRGRGFTDSELIAAGLAIQGNRGPRDRFRGRLMWPIRDLSGDVIAFGARKLDADEDGPKYLNTPETSLFRKSTVLYGADLAKREIAQRRQAVIVEGYTDVMACHLAGVPTAVATCGTSFGEDHIKVLRRLIMDTEGSAGEVIFTFDGDAAGQRAALRAFSLEEKFVTQTFVTVQPDGLDPCDVRLAHGDAAVRNLVARRVPLFEFAVKGVLGHHNLNTTEGQLAALDEAAPIVAKIKDQGLRTRYAVNLDRWLGLMDERFVLARVRTHAGDTGSGRRRSGQDRKQEDRGGQPGSFGTNGAEHGGQRGRRPALRPGRSRRPGGAGGAEARGPAARAVRARVRRPGRGRVHRARAQRGVRPDRGVRRHVGRRRQRPGVGRPAAGSGTERAGAGVRDRAGCGAAADRRRTRRQVRGRPARPGGPARCQPRDRLGQGPAAAHESGGRTGRLQQDVRGAGGAGETQEGAA